MDLKEIARRSIDAIPGSTDLLPGARPPQDGSDAFGAMLTQAASAVVEPQRSATAAIEQFTKGAEGELHQTMLAQERAEVTLKFFVSVRNRCLEAYREIMRMGS